MVTRLINVVSILVVTLAAIVIVWGLVADDRDDTRSGPAIAQVSPQFLKAAGVGPRIGRDDAPVVLVLYSDYRCSFCREFENTLRTVRMRYPEHLAVVVKSFVPLDTSEGTRLSLAAECAHEQGVFGAFTLRPCRWWRGSKGVRFGRSRQTRLPCQTERISISVLRRPSTRTEYTMTTL